MQKRLIDVDELIETLKSELEKKKPTKVFDYEIAEYLGMTSTALWSYKTRYELPVKYIVDFCVEHNRSVDELIFKSI